MTTELQTTNETIRRMTTQIAYNPHNIALVNALEAEINAIFEHKLVLMNNHRNSSANDISLTPQSRQANFDLIDEMRNTSDQTQELVNQIIYLAHTYQPQLILLALSEFNVIAESVREQGVNMSTISVNRIDQLSN